MRKYWIFKEQYDEHSASIAQTALSKGDIINLVDVAAACNTSSPIPNIFKRAKTPYAKQAKSNQVARIQRDGSIKKKTIKLNLQLKAKADAKAKTVAKAKAAAKAKTVAKAKASAKAKAGGKAKTAKATAKFKAAAKAKAASKAKDAAKAKATANKRRL